MVWVKPPLSASAPRRGSALNCTFVQVPAAGAGSILQDAIVDRDRAAGIVDDIVATRLPDDRVGEHRMTVHRADTVVDSLDVDHCLTIQVRIVQPGNGVTTEGDIVEDRITAFVEQRAAPALSLVAGESDIGQDGVTQVVEHSAAAALLRFIVAEGNVGQDRSNRRVTGNTHGAVHAAARVEEIQGAVGVEDHIGERGAAVLGVEPAPVAQDEIVKKCNPCDGYVGGKGRNTTATEGGVIGEEHIRDLEIAGTAFDVYPPAKADVASGVAIANGKTAQLSGGSDGHSCHHMKCIVVEVWRVAIDLTTQDGVVGEGVRVAQVGIRALHTRHNRHRARRHRSGRTCCSDRYWSARLPSSG